MSDDASTSRAQRWRPIALLIVAVACGSTLQVQVNYARNEVLDDARELATPIRELCADDVDAARRLGSMTCDRAAEVAARSSVVPTVLGAVGHVVTTRLLR